MKFNRFNRINGWFTDGFVLMAEELEPKGNQKVMVTKNFEPNMEFFWKHQDFSKLDEVEPKNAYKRIDNKTFAQRFDNHVFTTYLNVKYVDIFGVSGHCYYSEGELKPVFVTDFEHNVIGAIMPVLA